MVHVTRGVDCLILWVGPRGRLSNMICLLPYEVTCDLSYSQTWPHTIAHTFLTLSSVPSLFLP